MLKNAAREGRSCLRFRNRCGDPAGMFTIAKADLSVGIAIANASRISTFDLTWSGYWPLPRVQVSGITRTMPIGVRS